MCLSSMFFNLLLPLREACCPALKAPPTTHLHEYKVYFELSTLQDFIASIMNEKSCYFFS